MSLQDKFAATQLVLTFLALCAAVFAGYAAYNAYTANALQANAAIDANNSATEALHAGQRAWIVADNLKSLQATPYEVAHKAIVLELTLKNTGTSPATDIVVMCDTHSMKVVTLKDNWDRATKEINDMLGRFKEAWPTGVVLAPNQSYPIRISSERPWGDRPSDEEYAGGAFLILGTVSYKDQFGLPHTTRFAFNPDGDSVRPWDGKTFVIAGGYQSAD